MSKRLVVTYGDVTIYDDVPDRVSWQEDSSGRIRIEAGKRTSRSGLSEQQKQALANGLRKALSERSTKT